MQIDMNLCHDFDLAIAGELANWGHVPSDGENALDRYCLWFEMKERQIPLCQYRVLRSPELESRCDVYSLESVLGEITAAFQEGTSVAPYQSSRTGKLGKAGRDYLLLHWGIRHLHLSPISSIKPSGLVKRADQLLFVRVEGDVVHFIDILPHEDPNAFERKSLIEIVERNWPHLHTRLRTGLVEREVAPDERHALRRGNVIHMEEIDGKLVMPTFGVSTAGSPAEATRSFDRHQLQLAELEKLLRETPEAVFPEIAARSKAEVRLAGMWECGFDLFEVGTRLTRRVQMQ